MSRMPFVSASRKTPKLRADFLSLVQKAKFGLISRLSKDEEWGRRDLNPDRRVSPTRGATHACCANHGSALQSVITGISKPVRHQAHDWSP